jgi:hypothetical protein
MAKKYIEVTWTETRRVVVVVDDQVGDVDTQAYELVHSQGYDKDSEFIDQGETTCKVIGDNEGAVRAVNR